MKDICDLHFPLNDYTLETVEYRGKPLVRRAYMHLPYVSKPVDIDYQSLDVFVPVSYGGKTFDASKAPIVLLNRCGGYRAHRNRGDMPPMPPRPERKTKPGDPRVGPAPGCEGHGPSSPEESLLAPLSAGFVVVVPGNRGVGCLSPEGRYYGKAPAVIVDLKAAVRYLRHNAGVIPGNVERIISRGASAGGGMSALLSCSGNDEAYEPYLRAIGAANERDDVFAGVCLSPVLDLEHQDCAYEWQYGKLPLNGFDNIIKPPVDQVLSAELSAQFEEYLRTLNLRCQGEYGLLTPENYKDYYLNEFLMPAAGKWLREQDADKVEVYLEDRPWISWDGNKASFSFADYETYLGRLKPLPPFDRFELGCGENTVFGTENEEAHHYTAFTLRKTSGDPEATVPSYIMNQRNLLNPMVRLRMGSGTVARHWWIRMGAKESGFACPLVVNVATMLENMGQSVNFRLNWDGGHCSEDDIDAQMAWIADISGYQA